MDGEAFLFDGNSITESMEKSIIENMTKAIEEQYEGLLAKVEESENDPEKLNMLFKEFSDVKNRDYFQSNKGKLVYDVFVELQKKLNGECQS